MTTSTKLIIVALVLSTLFNLYAASRLAYLNEQIIVTNARVTLFYALAGGEVDEMTKARAMLILQIDNALNE